MSYQNQKEIISYLKEYIDEIDQFRQSNIENISQTEG